MQTWAEGAMPYNLLKAVALLPFSSEAVDSGCFYGLGSPYVRLCLLLSLYSVLSGQ